MSKREVLPPQAQAWVDARRRHGLSHAHVQMARELGLNPAKLGKLDNHRQEPWKAPLPQFIEYLYAKRFGRSDPTLSSPWRSVHSGPGAAAPNGRPGGLRCAVNPRRRVWASEYPLRVPGRGTVRWTPAKFDDLRALSTGAHSAAARIEAGNVIIELT